MKYLFFYPAASEFRSLETMHDFDENGDDLPTWAYEWKGRAEGNGFATEAEAYAAALIEGDQLYPGIVPAKGDENAYGAVLVDDNSI